MGVKHSICKLLHPLNGASLETCIEHKVPPPALRIPQINLFETAGVEVKWKEHTGSEMCEYSCQVKCSDSEGPHLIDCGALRCFFFPHGSFWFTLHFSLAGFSPGPHSALHVVHSSFGCLMTPWWNSAADHTTTLRLNRNWRWRRGDEILLDISQLLRNAQRSHGLSS